MRRGVRIGADVGSVRVGIAICDPDGLIATPEGTLARDAVAGTDFDRVLDLVDEKQALEVIVGLPRSLDGHEGTAAAVARRWATQLHRRRPELSIRMVDERLTTVDAHRVMREAGVSTRRSRSVIDSQAAAMILQVALDTERTTGSPAGAPVGGRKPRHRGGARQKGSE